MNTPLRNSLFLVLLYPLLSFTQTHAAALGGGWYTCYSSSFSWSASSNMTTCNKDVAGQSTRLYSTSPTSAAPTAGSASCACLDWAPPTGTISIQGTVKTPATGHASPGTTTTSSTYTISKNVTLSFAGVGDVGWSGIKGYNLSCNGGTAQWTAGTPAASRAINLDSFCNAGEGAKTFTFTIYDNADRTSTSTHTITYDATAPNISGLQSSLIFATNSFVVPTLASAVDAIGIKDYSVSWIEPGQTEPQMLDKTSVGATNLGTVAQTVVDGSNATNGRRNAQVKVTIEDHAGNVSSGTYNIAIIAGNVQLYAPSTVTFSSTATGPKTIADGSDAHNYEIALKDSYGNVVRPVPSIRTINMNASMANTVNFLPSGTNYADGAVYYNWDGNGFSANNAGNSYTHLYSNNEKTSGVYTFGVKSLVPTGASGYEYAWNKNIKVGGLTFTSANTCLAGYECSTIQASNAVNFEPRTNTNLSFSPALEVNFEKNWQDITDNTWHDITVKLKNNSQSKTFTLDEFRFNMHYTSDLVFADAMVDGDMGKYDTPETSVGKSFQFSLLSAGETDPNAVTIGALAEINKTIKIRVNSYMQGFGKIGFSSFVPHINGDNDIGGTSTSYNTSNLGLTPNSYFGYQTEGGSYPADANVTGAGSSGQKIAIVGAVGVNSNNSNQAQFAVENGNVAVDTSNISQSSFRANVRQNVATITRGITPIATNCNTSINLSSLTSTGEVIFYDFSGKNAASAINGNQGCVVELSGSPSGVADNYRKIWVTGSKTLIIKGGNLYINTDMYYATNSSLLGIVVLRDENNKKNGGNIYINPKVTNAIGTTFAEGSVMSYNGTKIYDNDNTQEGELTRQLLWFGSIGSSNSIGGSLAEDGATLSCPVGSDLQVQTGNTACGRKEASKYDLAILRRFYLVQGGGAGSACDLATKASPKWVGTLNEQWAFAGKKECYPDQTPPVGLNLRTTPKTTSLVIEYNPIAQSIPLKVFSESN